MWYPKKNHGVVTQLLQWLVEPIEMHFSFHPWQKRLAQLLLSPTFVVNLD